MRANDARKIPQKALEIIRQRAVAAVNDGMLQKDAAKLFGVSRASVNSWCKAHENGGNRALLSKPKGRPKESKLKPLEAALIVRTITGNCPNQLIFPFALWTREAVKMLIYDRFEIELSIWTIGRYLKRWGFTPQKPLKRAYERSPKAVEKWLKEDYPNIKKRAKSEGAEIFWGDEMGLRSNHQAGKSYGRCGQTPVIMGTEKRFKCNMISAITNKGNLSFMVFEEKFTYKIMTEFLRRMIRHIPNKIFFITDSHPVHKSAKIKKWLEKHHDKIEMFFLPSYSLELNPDELL